MNARLPMCRGLFLALLLLNCVVLARGSAQQKPSFRGGVELVLLDVSVLDAERRPVRGLTAADFTILEDGKPQTVASFSAVDLADIVTERTVTAPWVRAVAPDVQKNTDIKDRNIVVIVMDDATPMAAQDVPMAKAVARQVIDALGPNDLACVVYALNRRLGQGFTQDKARLLAAVYRFNGAIDSAGIDEKGAWWPRMPFDKFNVMSTTQYLAMLQLIQGMAEDLATLPDRRKALVFVSVGIPLDAQGSDVSTAGSDNAGGPEAVRDVWRSVQASLDAARQANVTIYGIDPGLLRGPFSVPTADPTGLNPGRPNREFLKTVSENTGGFAITDTNEPAPQIQQLLRENASYYLLGYAPSNTRALGRYRRIEVKVNRPGLMVRARKGYMEPEPATAKKATPVVASALGAIAGLLPKTDLPMSLAVAPFAVPGQKNATLAIVIGVECPALRRQGRVTERFDLRVAAYAPTGERRAAIQQVMTVAVNASGEGGTVRFEQLARLDVPPGRYHVRAAAKRLIEGATEDSSGREGSVYTDVDVPDFRREPLALTGVSLNVSPSVMCGQKDALATILPFAPTTTREFWQDDVVTGFLRVHQGGDRPIVPVDVAIKIVDATGASAFASLETLGGERFGKARAADVRFDVPVAKLAPGAYLLSVETVAGEATKRREIRLAVKSR